MITAKTQFNLRNAKGYFEEHLSVGDYYQEGQKTCGEWFGEGASRLGLRGKVAAKEFLALCDNLHPQSCERLTQRQKGIGPGSNRRIFYDFTFSPPKSVSIMALVAGDERIVHAHERALRVALKEFEQFAATRVRKAGADGHRLTGNIVAATFTHDTSRALDPHLHSHCIVFNATFDETEKCWKALQNYEMLRARKFVENLYYHELAKSLSSFGYAIRNSWRGDFQIEGVSDDLCELFSKRHEQIDDALKALLASKPELAGGNLKEFREQLATAERSRKMRDVGRFELEKLWSAQVTPDERDGLQEMVPKRATTVELPSDQAAREALEWAEQHLFDRSAVVLEHELWRYALVRGRGQPIELESLKRLTARRAYIRDSSQVPQVTTKKVLAREWEIVTTAKEGVGAHSPLVPAALDPNQNLDVEQQMALDRLLSSCDFVTLFRGGAGTGKSFVLRELVSHLEATGQPVSVIAPQRQQIVDLAAAGFPQPTTVTDFLMRQSLQPGGVVLTDEGGQIGGRQMLELIRLVQSRNGRLVLSGDTRQHGPVEVSDAMAAMEKFAGLKPAELGRIKRQNPALGKTAAERGAIRSYRNAVATAASGRLQKSFHQLDEMGAVTECRLGEQQERLAAEYLRLSERGDSVVVISQTWAEVQRVNECVRAALKAKRLLEETEHRLEALEKIDVTNAQKRDERFHGEGRVIAFNRNVRGAEPGTLARFVGMAKQGIIVETDGHVFTVLNRWLDRISVYRKREISVAPGERLQLKANRRMSTGATVANGELVTVASVRADGAIDLADGRVLDTNYREFVPGYAVTSYGSQGKTVDYVLFSDSTIKAATNDQQWYVTISRGRKGIRIFTPDKWQLRENLARAGQRPLALDLAGFAPGLRQRFDPWLRRFGRRISALIRCAQRFRRFNLARKAKHEQQVSRMLVH